MMKAEATDRRANVTMAEYCFMIVRVVWVSFSKEWTVGCSVLGAWAWASVMGPNFDNVYFSYFANFDATTPTSNN